MRSLFSGVSGLKVHQTRMDNIGNNIANINTVGFKSTRTTFSDILSQTQSGAAAPSSNVGGTNPKQVGLGVAIASMDLLFTDGSPQNTGKNTDVALSGNGLFVVQSGNAKYYTRDGAFSFDEEGYYVLPGSGQYVLGWNAVEGSLNTNAEPQRICVPSGKTMPAERTTQMVISGNLNASIPVITEINGVSTIGQEVDVTSGQTIKLSDGTSSKATSDGRYVIGNSIPVQMSVTIYDSLGDTHEVPVLMERAPSADQTSEADGIITDKLTAWQFKLSAGTDNEVVQGYTAVLDDSGNPVSSEVTIAIYGLDENTGSYTWTVSTTTLGPSSGTTDSLVEESLNTTVTVQKTDNSGNPLWITASGGTTTDTSEASTLGGNPVPATETKKVVVDTAVTEDNAIQLDDGTIVRLTTGNTYVFFDSAGAYNKIENSAAPNATDEDFGIAKISLTYPDYNSSDATVRTVTSAMNQVYGATDPETGQTIDARVSIIFNDPEAELTQRTSSTGNSTAYPHGDGNEFGTLQSVSIDTSGIVTGAYTNGRNRYEAQIAVAQFTNASGLTKIGTSLYSQSNNSGEANIKTAPDLGLTITPSALEMSNVDLANEFSEMIITQRGFQANSKIINTGDEMLETLVNMKR